MNDCFSTRKLPVNMHKASHIKRPMYDVVENVT